MLTGLLGGKSGQPMDSGLRRHNQRSFVQSERGETRWSRTLLLLPRCVFYWGTLILQHRGRILHEFSIQKPCTYFSHWNWCIPRRLLSDGDQFHEICQTAWTAFIHLAEKSPYFFLPPAVRVFSIHIWYWFAVIGWSSLKCKYLKLNRLISPPLLHCSPL